MVWPLVLDEASFQRLIEEHAEFIELIRERIAQYRTDQEATLPVDFAQELLPAEASVSNKLDIDEDGPGRRVGRK